MTAQCWELVTRRGWTKAAAAEFFGVSGAAVTRAFQRMEVAVARNIPAQQAGAELLKAQVGGGMVGSPTGKIKRRASRPMSRLQLPGGAETRRAP
ncbi:MAG: hypothetical protein A2051_08405 [Desulfovibrionales bacterium GWA2_65_9]|nr:MAG: hypothetical protein A2051_08405 [Desulfovibrionales bacterium GWA2_65_9]